MRQTEKEATDMKCTTDAWSGGDYTERLAEANVRQLDEINKLEVRVIRQNKAIAILSQDRPFAELIAAMAAEPFSLRAFGWGLIVATGFWWVMAAP